MSMSTKYIPIIGIIAVLLAIGGLLYTKNIQDPGFSHIPSQNTPEENGVTQSDTNSVDKQPTPLPPPIPTGQINPPEIIARNLNIPWDITFLPNGDLLIPERSGELVRIGSGETYHRTTIPNVEHVGEGGLLGIALHPQYAQNGYIYIYITADTESKTINRVERYRYENDQLLDKHTIIDAIPGARFHNGGRIDFGPDGKLYITTGDATEKDLAQQITSLAGKILRLNDDGTIPTDNPFNSPIYSYGHRNPQGLTWDASGRLWSTEHGRSGLFSGYDELNIIQKGKNYGWPEIQGDETRPQMIPPALHSGPEITWAPASAAYWDGSIFFGGLRGEALYEARINSGSITIERHFYQERGRIRAVRVGPDGMLYISTSNKDGRGRNFVADDKIIKIDPRMFRENS